MDALSFFISNAFAEVATAPASPTAASGGGFSLFLMALIMLVFGYFGIWRPQAKRAKEQQSLLGSLAKGDEVMSAGGMIGRISKITDQYIVLNIANNVEIIIQKSAVVSVLPKGTIKSIE